MLEVKSSPTWVLVLVLAVAGGAVARAASHGQVTIYRDAKGVPHIVGADSSAVMYGLGYATAQDRLAQMELARRSALGTQAEILGSAAVAADMTARDRLIGNAELMRMYAAIPEEHRAMMQSFIDGINREIAEISQDPRHKTPYEFSRWGIAPKPWTLLDFLARIAAMPNGRAGYELQNLAFLNAMVAKYGEKTGRLIFEDVVPINDPDSPTTIPPGEDLAPVQPMPKPGRYLAAPLTAGLTSPPQGPSFDGPTEASRCLVIGPKRSANGHVMMMEATADGPESHLYGGGFDTAGFSALAWGSPIMGRSLEHGWLLTSGHADTTDTYAERLKPADKYQSGAHAAVASRALRALRGRDARLGGASCTGSSFPTTDGGDLPAVRIFFDAFTSRS